MKRKKREMKRKEKKKGKVKIILINRKNIFPTSKYVTSIKRTLTNFSDNNYEMQNFNFFRT